MKNLRILLVVLVAVAVGVALDRLVGVGPARAVADAALPSGPAAPAPPPAVPPRIEDPRAVYRVPLGDSPARGASDALVTVVVASDFECPFCKQGAQTLRQVQQAYPGKVRVVFKQNPLSMHPHALDAALVAEGALAGGGDDKFWEVHDRLFELPGLDGAALQALAREVGLDEGALKAGRLAMMARVQRDQNLMASLGARGTPTFFVNGRKLVGALPLEQFKPVVEEELARAEALVKAGTPRRDVYAKATEQGATAPVMVAAPPSAAPAAPAEAAAARIPLRADDVVSGPPLAPVTVVVFSDFQCPFCGRVEPTLKQLEQAFPGQLRFAWKHQPLDFHPNALPAAKAAEAARAQGRFWEMHDQLFARQQALSPAAYEEAAAALKLDLVRFRKDAVGQAAARRISEDQALAASVGATGTPTVFVNCRRLVGAKPLEAFKAVVEEELKKASAPAARGEPLDAGSYDRACAANVAAAPPPPAARAAVAVPLRADDPSRGPRDAKVTVVEFSDFQCPFCGRAVPAVKALEQAFGRDVRVVWKHLPLSFHPNAMPAALAAEAARQQGRFWEMHDRLFAGQQALSEAAYVAWARELGLDVARFEAATRDPATRARVEEDARAAAAAGVTGTPTFVVDGEAVVGSAALQDAVRRHLEKARLAKREPRRAPLRERRSR